MASGTAQGQQSVDCLRPIPTRQLSEGIVRRTFTDPQQVAQLIRDGADPNAEPCPWVRGAIAALSYRLLALAVDNLSDGTLHTIQVDDSHGRLRHLTLPRWPSAELEAAIINALIDGGAHVNPPAHVNRPIRVAVECANENAVRVLLARGAAVRRLQSPFLIMELPTSTIFDGVGHQVSLGYEQRLLSIYRRLIQHDPTLATKQIGGGQTLIQKAAWSERGHYSQAFIDSYLDLLVDKGASLTAVNGSGWTALHSAIECGSPCVTDYLCRHVAAADIDRETTGGGRRGPSHQQDSPLRGDHPQLAENRSGHRPHPHRHRGRHGCRQLVLTQCTTVLNTDIHTGAMAALNAALAPQRSLAALMTHLLPLVDHNDGEDPAPSPLSCGPHEAEAIGWRIAAMCFDQHAANETITAKIGIRNSDMARRVCAAVDRSVKSALYASSNREVVGGTANVGGVTVRVPLQCFAIRADSRPHQVVHTRGRVGVREVVQRARLDEAARHGIEEGAINKGFNEHLGNADCQFGGWQQLGRIDERGQWVTLGID
ncbi:unnamed protein product [Vitrella brassicaformis CCMP3155]|uniref:Uncharacterized protein n=1 Tax=Vitrella brassicaformis (strain CCMP3155) TaxID=1169540 RepID=A0A0G4G5H6_VITBC|nr:unnamed protein product [Vitrella brassicaformis CCMP3155]|eukprot:CEM23800.1 unnamed protein product [Vitrella brassicaformis CCMP3155]